MAHDTHAAPPPGFDAGLVARVLDDALAAGARVYGISGLQGSGKSTLAAQLVDEAGRRGVRAVALSLDDFYLDAPERASLARAVHPLLATRGPPGTHDVGQACAVLDALRAGQPVRVPRFDKLADRRLPPAQWHAVARPGLVLFEGWCLGAPAEVDEALAAPLNRLERAEDGDGRWRRWCNAALGRDYPALWQRIDRLLFLRPPCFEVVPGWRWQQEQALRAREPGRGGMSRAQAERFVQHYERVSRQVLRSLPALADAVIALDAERRPSGLDIRGNRR